METLTRIKNYKELGQPAPKFKVGDIVLMPSNLYGEVTGEVTATERIYKTIESWGDFDPDGLVTAESTIAHCQLPYAFDGETLVVHYPENDMGTFVLKEHSRTAKFWGWNCTVKSKKLNTLINENHLVIIKRS